MHPSAELPLIAFTLFTQLAIGIVLLSPLILWKCDTAEICDKIIGQRKIALIFMIIGAILSVIHLGSPLHSPYAMLHVGTSWLAREIVLVVLTCIALALAIWLSHKNPESSSGQVLFWAAWVLSLFLLYAMSRVYNSPFLPGWAGGQTFFLFLATALLLGSLWMGWILARKADPAQPAVLWRIFFAAMAGFVLLAICAPFSIFSTEQGVNPLSMAYNMDTLAVWRGVEAILCGIAVAVLALAVWKGMRQAPAAKWLFAALLLGICGEIAGRCAFYMAYARLGV